MSGYANPEHELRCVNRLLRGWAMLLWCGKAFVAWLLLGVGVLAFNFAARQGVGLSVDAAISIATVWGWSVVPILIGVVIGLVFYFTGYGFGAVRTVFTLLLIAVLWPLSLFQSPWLPGVGPGERRVKQLIEKYDAVSTRKRLGLRAALREVRENMGAAQSDDDAAIT